MMSIGGIDSGVKISVLRELVLSPFCCCPFNGVLYPLTLLCLGPSKPQSGLKSKRLRRTDDVYRRYRFWSQDLGTQRAGPLTFLLLSVQWSAVSAHIIMSGTK